jgi:hypothetical protein
MSRDVESGAGFNPRSRSGALGSLARDDEAGLVGGYDGLGAVA